jgi:hypothetical protein
MIWNWNSRSISNSLANFVSQILLFANSQNNMGRKKKISSPSVWQISSQKPKIVDPQRVLFLVGVFVFFFLRHRHLNSSTIYMHAYMSMWFHGCLISLSTRRVYASSSACCARGRYCGPMPLPAAKPSASLLCWRPRGQGPAAASPYRSRSPSATTCCPLLATMPWMKSPANKTKSPAKQRRAPLSNKEPARRKTDAKHGTRAYICALDREICQVEKDGELGWQTIGEGFFSFCQKNYGWRRRLSNCWRCSNIY